MNIYYLVLLFFIFLFTSCSTEAPSPPKTELLAVNNNNLGKEVIFNIISDNTNTIKDSQGVIKDSGHYSFILQALTKEDSTPIANLDDSDSYKMYENNRVLDETIIKIEKDTDTISNKILLLLDFSSSTINECNKVDARTDPSNLCYQIVNGSKKFIDNVITSNQTMAIYYFHSAEKANPLPIENNHIYTSDDKSLLKKAISKLYDSGWREDNLNGYNGTNLYGAVLDSTSQICRWFDDCKDGEQSLTDDKKIQDFASIIIFTDGQDTVNIGSTQARDDMLNALTLYNRNRYYIIGLGDISDETLKEIGKNGYFKAINNEEVTDKFEEVGSHLNLFSKSFYKFNYCPSQQGGELHFTIKLENKDIAYYGSVEESVSLLDGINYRCDL